LFIRGFSDSPAEGEASGVKSRYSFLPGQDLLPPGTISGESVMLRAGSKGFD
jgi:hypothetical protein